VTAPGPHRGIVFQHFALFPWKTVRSNILYGLERQGMPRPERERRAQAFIDIVGLRPSGSRNPGPFPVIRVSGAPQGRGRRGHQVKPLC